MQVDTDRYKDKYSRQMDVYRQMQITCKYRDIEMDINIYRDIYRYRYTYRLYIQKCYI